MTELTPASGARNYVSIFWNAVCAGFERGLTTPHTTVRAGIDALRVWLADFATIPRWNRQARNYTPTALPASTPAAGKYSDHSTNLPSAVNPCPANNCVYTGADGFRSLWDDWCGGAFAPTMGTYGSLLMFGGGHLDYFGNEVVAYDLEARTFSRLSNPDNYNNTNADANGAYPNGNPYPVHTNMGCDYLPPEAGGGTLGSYVFIGHDQTGVTVTNNNLWRFDLALRTWSRWQLAQNLGAFIGLCYDSYRKGLWAVGMSANDETLAHQRQLYFLNVATQTQTAVSVGSPGGLMTNALYLPSLEYVRNRDCLVYPIIGTGLPVNCIDLNGVVVGTTSFVPEFTIAQAGTKCTSLWSYPSGGGPGGSGLDYAACERFSYCSEDGGLYVLDMTNSSSVDLYKLTVPATLNGGTWTWTHETLTATSGEALALRARGIANVQDKHMFGRMRFVPKLKSFVISDGIRTVASVETALPAQLLRPAALT